MCGIAGIIGRLDDRNRAALERMNDAMIHRGPDASGTWVSAPELSRLGRAARAPPSLYPRSLARRRPAHGRPGDRARDRLQRRDLQFPRPSAAPGGRGAGDAVDRRHGRHAPRARPARARRGELAPRHVRLRLLGPQGAPAPAGQGSPRESSRSTWRGRRIRMRAGRWPSPRSFAPCWPPGCWARLASTRRPWPAACGTASWSALAPPSKASSCSGRAACSSSTVRARRFASRTSGASPTAHPIRSRTRTVWPPSWRRG